MDHLPGRPPCSHTCAMSLYLALDVGGTKTAAVLADEERIIAMASAGSIKTLRVPPAEAAHNLGEVLAKLEAQAGTAIRGATARTCVGTSGASAPTVRRWMQESFAAAVGGDLLLLGDEVIALDAAFRGGRGALVIAGTGSNIVGRAATGEMVHTGGWGPALADEGSGHWIGSETLRACFRAIDAAPPSTADAVTASGISPAVRLEHLPPLLVRVMEALHLQTLGDVIDAANAPAYVSATLVPVVLAAARGGDALAAEVLLHAGRELAGLVSAVISKVTRLELAQSSTAVGAPEVAFVGGILANIPEVRDAMHAALRERYPGIALQPAAVDPLAGALWHARGRPGSLDAGGA